MAPAERNAAQKSIRILCTSFLTFSFNFEKVGSRVTCLAYKPAVEKSTMSMPDLECELEQSKARVENKSTSGIQAEEMARKEGGRA